MQQSYDINYLNVRSCDALDSHLLEESFRSGPLLKARPATTFEWKIKNFFSLTHETDIFYESCSFSSPGYRWHLRMYPNGESERQSAGWIGLYLISEGQNSGHIDGSNIIYTFGIKVVNGAVEEKQTGKFLIKDGAHGYYFFLRRSTLLHKKSTLAPSDVLTVVCILRHDFPAGMKQQKTEHIGEISEIISKKKESTEYEGISGFIQDFRNLLNNGKDSDIILNVRGRLFKAHKLILKTRSVVFDRMLNVDMAEKSSNTIDINDCEIEAFEIFLRYLYTGKIENITEVNMFDVYYVADKYDHMGFKSECISHIMRSMNPYDICRVIELAISHTDTDLLQYASDYFIENVHDVLTTREWRSFLQKNPIEANDLIIKAFKHPCAT